MSQRTRFQAITTRYYGHTNTLCARIKAKASAGSQFYDWDDHLGVDENHDAAAKKLAMQFGWVGSWFCGALPNGRGYCFVCVTGPVEPAFEVI